VTKKIGPCSAYALEVAVTAEPAERARANASRHLVDVVLRGRRRLMDAHAAIAGLGEDAVDGERVEMNVKV
jgi:hypothetical protein